MQVPPQLRESWQGLRTSWASLGDGERQLVRALIGIALFVVLVLALFGNPFPRSLTYGEIWVDSPEIYTRERLVNDRFIQDAWLSQQLNRSKDARDALQVLGSRTQANLLPAGVPAVGSTAAPASEAAPQLSSRDRFLGELDFRELVRNLAIENQLDDRHDMHGHSLYRLKFDASVAPGDNTQATAIIEVTLKAAPSIPVVPKKGVGTEPLAGLGDLGNDQEKNKWRKVYQRWLDNLASRLNETNAEFKQAYDHYEFRHNDYVKYIWSLERTLDMTAAGLGCPSDVTKPIADPEADPLTPEEHQKRRECINIFYRQAAVLAASNPTLAIGEDDFLNAYFAPQSLQLVLGTSLEHNLIGTNLLSTLPSLLQLASLSVLSVQTNDYYGRNVFFVQARRPQIMAIDKSRINEKNWAEVEKRMPNLVPEYKDFIDLPKTSTKYKISRPDYDAMVNDGYVLQDSDFSEMPESPGLYVAYPETGLLNFARKAGANPPAFTYAVTPKESADTVDASLASGSRVNSGELLKALNGTALTLEREQSNRALQRRGTVVGFGQSSDNDEKKARFGWVVAPRVPSLDGQRLTYVQGVGQYSLSALVSMPSWWDEVDVTVTTTWVNPDGSKHQRAGGTAYTLRIPTDFEPLETTLLDLDQRGPKLLESRLDAIRLTACQPGAIVIPGRRLWRSTKVSLGYQLADEIAVLPDMKGIVATFRSVQNQASLDEMSKKLEIRRPVKVWTSQGTLTLPYPARIGIQDTRKPCDAAPAASSAKP